MGFSYQSFWVALVSTGFHLQPGPAPPTVCLSFPCRDEVFLQNRALGSPNMALGVLDTACMHRWLSFLGHDRDSQTI